MPGVLLMNKQAIEAGLSPAFFLSLGVFLFVLLAISLRWMHKTAAALIGVVALWLVTYIGGTFVPDLHFLDFVQAMASVDWNVIFLILVTIQSIPSKGTGGDAHATNRVRSG